jgi:hypothetical protein
MEQKGGQFIDLAYNIVYPVVGKILYILGVPDRREVETTEAK